MARLVGWLTKGIEFLTWVLAGVGGMLLCLIIAFVVYGVVMRYLFRTPKAWVNEAVALMYLPLIAFGLAYALRTKAHVHVDLLLTRLPLKTQQILNVVTMPLFLTYSALLVWGGWLRAQRALASAMYSVDAHIPFFPLWVLFPIGAGLLCLQAALELARNITALKGGLDRSLPTAEP